MGAVGKVLWYVGLLALLLAWSTALGWALAFVPLRAFVAITSGFVLVLWLDAKMGPRVRPPERPSDPLV